MAKKLIIVLYFADKTLCQKTLDILSGFGRKILLDYALLVCGSTITLCLCVLFFCPLRAVYSPDNRSKKVFSWNDALKKMQLRALLAP